MRYFCWLRSQSTYLFTIYFLVYRYFPLIKLSTIFSSSKYLLFRFFLLFWWFLVSIFYIKPVSYFVIDFSCSKPYLIQQMISLYCTALWYSLYFISLFYFCHSSIRRHIKLIQCPYRIIIESCSSTLTFHQLLDFR